MAIVRAVGLAAAVLLPAASAAAQDPPRADASSALSTCAVAEDTEYGYSKLKPVEIGGGPMYVAARERRYMDALRGPAGEPLQYKRIGSLPQNPPNSMVILDHYEVTYAGLEKPVSIYLNAYHYDDRFRAPQGFRCGTPVQLAPPGPDPFLTDRELIALAIEQGSSRDFDPIPLAGGGGKLSTLGAIRDQFRIVAAEARAAAARGTPLTFEPKKPVPSEYRARTIVVAYPLPCEDRKIAPTEIAVVPPPGGSPVPRQGDIVKGDALRALLPGMTPPDGSIAVVFPLATPRQRDAFRIVYAEPCGGFSEISAPVEMKSERPIRMPDPQMPAGLTVPPANVYLQVQLDSHGKLQRPLHIGGPKELLPAALEAIKGWTAEPARINGAPVTKAVTVAVRFAPPAR